MTLPLDFENVMNTFVAILCLISFHLCFYLVVQAFLGIAGYGQRNPVPFLGHFRFRFRVAFASGSGSVEHTRSGHVMKTFVVVFSVSFTGAARNLFCTG